MKILTPQTKDRCCPAITATYEYAALANMFDTAHYPRGGGFRTIKFNQHKVSWANYLRVSTYGATAVVEFYEIPD